MTRKKNVLFCPREIVIFLCNKTNKCQFFDTPNVFFFVEKRGSQQCVTKNRKREKTTFSLDVPVPQDENTRSAKLRVHAHVNHKSRLL